MISTWKYFVLKKFWTCFSTLFLLTILFYTAVSYSLHSVKGSSSAGLWSQCTYYIAQIMLKAEFLFPQILALSTTLSLFSMQNRREILLLRAAGLSLKRLLRPLIYSTCLIIGLLYANFEWIHPLCEKICTTRDTSDSNKHDRIYSLYLKDQSILLYSSIDHATKTLDQCFWIQDPQHIFTIEKLSFTSYSSPRGQNVLLFTKKQNDFVQETSFQERVFKGIEFGAYNNPFSNIFIADATHCLSDIITAIPWESIGIGMSTQFPQRVLSLLSYFYYMLIAPLTSLAALVFAASFSLRFSRVHNASLAYLAPLAILNIFFIFLKAGMVLTSSSVLPIFPTMAIPFGIFCVYTGIVYARLR